MEDEKHEFTLQEIDEKRKLEKTIVCIDKELDILKKLQYTLQRQLQAEKKSNR